MELRQLRYFVEVAECKGLSSAVKNLHVAQPALSRSIKDLEQEIGAELFTRSNQGMELTEVDQGFFDHFYRILRQVDAAQRCARESHENSAGLIALGMITSASHILSVPLYRAVRARYPSITLVMQEGLTYNLEQQLDAGSFDLIIDVERVGWQKCTEVKLVSEHLYLVGKERGVAAAEPPLDFSAAKKFLVDKTPPDHRMPGDIERYFRQDDPEGKLSGYYLDYHPAIRLMLAGEINGILPWASIFDCVGSGRLVAHEISDLSRTVSLHVPLVTSPSLALDKVIDIIKEVTTQMHSEGKWRGELLVS